MIFDVIIIGGGPAGISASSYCNRLGLCELLIYEEFGGQVNYCDRIFSIPSSPAISKNKLLSNYKTTSKNVNQIKTKVISLMKKDNLFYVFTNDKVYSSKTVIVCTGAIPKRIEDLIDVSKSTIPILTYLDYPYENHKIVDSVVIIGGGYVGLEIAYHLSKKSRMISIVEANNCLGGNKYRQKSLDNMENIDFYFNSILNSIVRNKIYISQNGAEKALTADVIFSAYGVKPRAEILPLINTREFGVEVIRNSSKCFINMSKEIRGLFAAGDVVNLPINGFVSFAEGMGIETAKAVFNYLHYDRD